MLTRTESGASLQLIHLISILHALHHSPPVPPAHLLLPYSLLISPRTRFLANSCCDICPLLALVGPNLPRLSKLKTRCGEYVFVSRVETAEENGVQRHVLQMRRTHLFTVSQWFRTALSFWRVHGVHNVKPLMQNWSMHGDVTELREARPLHRTCHEKTCLLGYPANPPSTSSVI